jgi:hypothetical protein
MAKKNVYWQPYPTENAPAVVIYPYEKSGDFQLSLELGERVELLEITSDKTWYRGLRVKTGEVGIFPVSFVQVLPPQDPVVMELHQILTEWLAVLKDYYRQNRMSEYNALYGDIITLVKFNSQLTSPTTSQEVKNSVKVQVLDRIEESRRKLGQDVILRTSTGDMVTEHNTPIIELFQMHMATVENAKEKFGGENLVVKNKNATTPKNVIVVKRENMSQSLASPSLSALTDPNIPQTLAPSPQFASTHIPTSSLTGGQTTTSFHPARPSFVSALNPGRPPLSNSSPSGRFQGMSVSITPSMNVAATLSPRVSTTVSYLQRTRSFLRLNNRMNALFGSQGESIQILLNIKAFSIQVGEEVELYFSIYSNQKDAFLSEELHIEVTDKGNFLRAQTRAFFRDLSKNDMTSDLYLVCRVIRRGKLRYQSKKQTQVTVRRPFALGLFKIPERFVPAKEYDHTMSLVSPKSEDNFHLLPKFILKNEREKYAELSNPRALSFTITMFREDLEPLLAKYPNTVVCNKLQLPDVLPLNYYRNDLYVTLKSGNISSMANKKNIEVCIQVRNSKGEPFQDCIFLGSGEPGQYEFRSTVLYHTNTPIWNETFRITLPPEKWLDAHLYFSVKSVSSKVASSAPKDKEATSFHFYSMKKLINDDSTGILSTVHEIPLVKVPKEQSNDPTFYLKNQDEITKAKKTDTLSIKTNLVSNRITQNPIVAQLLNWRQNLTHLTQLLNRFTFISNDPDTLKFLPDVLDCLFGILDYKSEDEIAFAVYNTLVLVLDIVANKMRPESERFKIVLDEYLECQFEGTQTYKSLIKCLKYYFGDIDKVKSNDLVNTLKALGYLFKFITTSLRVRDELPSPTSMQTPVKYIIDPQFQKDIQEFLSSFYAMMRKTEQQWLGSQVIAIQYFFPVIQTLRPLFSNEDLVKMIESFLDNIQYNPKNQHLNIEKLNFILSLISDPIFLEKKGSVLLNVIIRHCTLHLKSKNVDEVVKCGFIIANLLDCFEYWKIPVYPLTDLIAPLISALSSDFDLRKLSVIILCLFTLFHLMKTSDYCKYILFIKNHEDRIDFLTNLYELLEKLITSNAFPEHWFAVVMFYYSTILKIIEETCLPLIVLLLGGEQDLITQLNRYQIEQVMEEQGLKALSRGALANPGLAKSGLLSAPQNSVAMRRMSTGLSESKELFLQNLMPTQSKPSPQYVPPSSPHTSKMFNEADIVDNSVFDAIDFDEILQQTLSQKPSTAPTLSATTQHHPPATPKLSASGSAVNPANSMTPPIPRVVSATSTSHMRTSSSGQMGSPLLDRKMFKAKVLTDKRQRSLQGGQLIDSSLKEKFTNMERPEINAKATGEKLWLKFTRLCICFIKAKVLQLEQFAPSKQTTIAEHYGDLRVACCNILRQLSEVLGKYQINLVSFVIGPLVELMLMENPDIRRTGLELYYLLIKEEYKQTKGLKNVEYHTIEHFDLLINKGLADKNFEDFFVKSLEVLVEQTEDPNLKAISKKYLNDINNLMRRLFELRSMPQEKQYEDEKVAGIVNLMEYLKRTDRLNLYTKYCHALTSLHLKLENFAEAGNSILLHANVLEWNWKLLLEDEVCHLPAQFQKERKYHLYKTAVSYFDKGKYWEEAIKVLDVCAQQLRIDGDYNQLVEILQMQIQFYKNICTVERVWHEYFRVGFYGRGFGEMQNKEFIYKGNVFERLEDFGERLKSRWTNAEFLNYTDPPTLDVINSDKQYIQFFAVKPASREELEGRERKFSDKMPYEARKYLIVNDTDVFVYARSFRKNKKKDERPLDEVKDLWIRKTFYITAKKFPQIERRCLIVETKEVILDPIENAIQSMVAKNREIEEAVEKFTNLKNQQQDQKETPTQSSTQQQSQTPSLNVNHFTMLLKGVIEAAVNGGPDLFRQAFIDPEYMRQNPTKISQVNRLKTLLLDQLTVLETAMKLHDVLCPDSVRELHSQLEGKLAQCKRQWHDHFSKQNFGF